MEICDLNGKKEFFNKYDVIDSILLQPEVKDRKVVILSIIGEYRKGKSFFLGYCLKFMYANVSNFFFKYFLELRIFLLDTLLNSRSKVLKLLICQKFQILIKFYKYF